MCRMLPGRWTATFGCRIGTMALRKQPNNRQTPGSDPRFEVDPVDIGSASPGPPLFPDSRRKKREPWKPLKLIIPERRSFSCGLSI